MKRSFAALDQKWLGNKVGLCDFDVIDVQSSAGIQFAFATEYDTRVDAGKQLAATLPTTEVADKFELDSGRRQLSHAGCCPIERDRFHDFSREQLSCRLKLHLTTIDLNDASLFDASDDCKVTIPGGFVELAILVHDLDRGRFQLAVGGESITAILFPKNTAFGGTAKAFHWESEPLR